MVCVLISQIDAIIMPTHNELMQLRNAIKAAIKAVNSSTDTHKHRCGECNYIWRHGDNMAGNKKAHTCPRCGQIQWYQYTGLQRASRKIVRTIALSCARVTNKIIGK